MMINAIERRGSPVEISIIHKVAYAERPWCFHKGLLY